MNISEKMQLTIQLAKEALDKGELPVGAMIFLDDEVIAAHYTSEKTDKRFLVHAEIKALLEADAKGYSIRQRKQMQLFVTLEPCMMCLGAAMSFFIGEIYYALESPIDGAVHLAQNWNPQSEEIPGYTLPQIAGGVLREESRALFAEYIQRNSTGPLYELAKSLAHQ
jgi:tRNA(adenine34) deaminase